MAAEEVKGMERMPGGRKRQKGEVKETRVDRWLSLPHQIGLILKAFNSFKRIWFGSSIPQNGVMVVMVMV